MAQLMDGEPRLTTWMTGAAEHVAPPAAVDQPVAADPDGSRSVGGPAVGGVAGAEVTGDVAGGEVTGDVAGGDVTGDVAGGEVTGDVAGDRAAGGPAGGKVVAGGKVAGGTAGPVLDGDGLLRHAGRWVPIPDTQIPVADLLVRNVGTLVASSEIRATYIAAGGSGSATSLRSLVHRLGRRVAAVGLRLHVVRGRGVILDGGDHTRG